MLEADVQEAGLGAGHPLQEGQQRHRLLTLIPALEPIRQDANLVSEHHGVSPREGEQECVGREGDSGKTAFSHTGSL